MSTLREIGEKAHERTQELLASAKGSVHEAEERLKELAGASYFTNGLASELTETHAQVGKLGERIEKLQGRLHEHFHPETNKDESRAAKIRGEG